MAEEFADRVLKSSIAQLCLSLGWQNANVSALDVSSDVAKRFMLKTGSLAAKFAEIGESPLRQTPHMRAKHFKQRIQLQDGYCMLPSLSLSSHWEEFHSMSVWM